MKNKNQITSGLVQFIKSELEVTLAILILFAFVVGYSFAQTPTPEVTPDTTAQSEEVAPVDSDKFIINGHTYNGLTFYKRISGFYRVTTFSGGTMSVSDNGLTFIEGTNYATVNLDVPMKAGDKWYMDYDGAFIDVNGRRITDRTTALDFGGAKTIQIKAQGYVTIRTISTTRPTGASQVVTAPVIGSLYMAPTLTTLTPGTTRTFLLVAVDQYGSSMSTDGAVWSSSNTSIAKIDAKTGVVMGLAPGSVTITATIGTAKASATVTVKEVPQEEVVAVQPQPTTSTSTSTSTTTKTPATTETTTSNATDDAVTALFPSTETQSASAAVDTAVSNLFSAETVAARSATTGFTHATQNEINTAMAELPTLTQKVTFRIKVAVNDIATSLREMVLGYMISSENGTVQEKPSAIKAIAGFIGNLIGQPRGSNAGLLKINPDDDN